MSEPSVFHHHYEAGPNGEDSPCDICGFQEADVIHEPIKCDQCGEPCTDCEKSMDNDRALSDTEGETP